MQGMSGTSQPGGLSSAKENLPEALKLPLAPPRLGRLRGLFEELADAAVRKTVDEASRSLVAKGASLTEHGLPAAFSEVIRRHRVVMAVEAAAFHESRLRDHPED